MPYQLHTRNDVRLVRDGGDSILLSEPLAFAFLVILAVAGSAGVAADDLLLLLTPDLTPEKGKAEIARLASGVAGALGDDASIVRTGTAFALRPGLVELDVDVLDGEAPNPCPEFLAEFTIPDVPELDEWIAMTRRRVIPRTLDVKRERAWRRPRRYVPIVLAAAAVSAAAVYVATPSTMSGFSAGDPLLVADVQNETGDSLFDAGVATAMTVALQQSSHLRLYPRARLPGIYRLMQLPNTDTALTFALARQVAHRDHVRFVLGVEIARADDRYRIVARLADVASDDAVRTMSADAASKAEVLAALDDVLAATRRRLGESRRDVADRRLPLPLVTTPSLEALRSYAEGSTAWSKGRYDEARELWTRAVDLDTGFAMAYGALGVWYYYHHDRPEGERHMREAFSRAHRLTEWERLRLLANEAAFSGMRDSAIALDRVVANRYPNAITWYDLGTALMRAGRDSEAEAALTKSLAFDSTHASTYINLATVARSRQRYDEALAYYAAAARLDSLALYNGNINLEWGSSYVYLGRMAEAESAFTRMSRAPGLYDRNLGFRALAALAMWQGHVDRAIDWYRKAIDASVQNKAPLSELRNRLALAVAYRSIGRMTEANEELTRAVRLAQDRRIEPRMLAMVAATCVKLGRVADADAMLTLVRARVGVRDPTDAAAQAYVESLLALTRHRVDSALVYLGRAGDLPEDVQLNALASEVYRAAGQMDSARAATNRILDYRAFGVEAQEDFLRAPLVLGDLLLANQDTAGAIKQYQRVIDQRRGAQREVSDVAAARTRLATLRSASGR
jgi:tetratricopeptide (TPR) repeat protein